MVRARLAEIFQIKQEKARATNNYRREDDPSIGLWTRCESCGVVSYNKHLRGFFGMCPNCGNRLQVQSIDRIAMLVDEDSWVPFYESLTPTDPLHFKDEKSYPERVLADQKYLRLEEAVQVGFGILQNFPIALGVMEFDFMAGTMGSVVGEKITRLIEYATYHGLPLILICASGGARMQEGSLSLMQMAKISSALRMYQGYAHLLYVPLLTSPTTGGVTASFGMLGDIILAEPNAVIAFAGRRVIEETLNEILPPDFQTAEYMWQHGLVDQVVERKYHREAYAEIFTLHYEIPITQKGSLPLSIYQQMIHPTLAATNQESPIQTTQFLTESPSNQEVSFSPLSNKIESQTSIANNKKLSSFIDSPLYFPNEKGLRTMQQNKTGLLDEGDNETAVFIPFNLLARKEFMPKRRINKDFLNFFNGDEVSSAEQGEQKKLINGSEKAKSKQVSGYDIELESLVKKLKEWDSQAFSDQD